MLVDEGTKERKGLKSSGDKTKAHSAVGRGEKRLLSGAESDLRVGRKKYKEKGAKIIDWMPQK